MYNPETKVVDLRTLKVMDIKDCLHLKLPAPMKEEEEMEYKTKETLRTIKYKNFMRKNFDDKGRILADNMMRQEW